MAQTSSRTKKESKKGAVVNGAKLKRGLGTIHPAIHRGKYLQIPPELSAIRVKVPNHADTGKASLGGMVGVKGYPP